MTINDLVKRMDEIERRQELLLAMMETGALAISKLSDAVVNIETYLKDAQQPETGEETT